MMTRFCGKSGTEDELFQVYNKLKSQIAFLGRITGIDRGRLNVRLNDELCRPLITYVSAMSIKGISLVGIEELLDKEFVFHCLECHGYEQTIELDSSCPTESISLRFMGLDSAVERCSLQKYVNEIVASKRRDFLYSLKVGEIYRGLVTNISEYDYFEADLGNDLKARVIHLEVADDNRLKRIGEFVRIGEWVPLKLMKFNAMTGEPYFSLKAARATER